MLILFPFQYVQSSVAARSNNKLAFKFFGPYTILQWIGAVAYKHQLPTSSSIHLIFHVSQLKSVVGQKHTVVPSLPTDIDGLQVHVQVLARRLIQCGGALVPQVKVAWSGWDHSLVTWDKPAWGQAVS